MGYRKAQTHKGYKMSKVYCPLQKKLIEKYVDETSPFSEIDDAMYWHERPYYRYATTGGGSNPNERPEWRRERERLLKLWLTKYPHTLDIDPCAIKGTSFVRKVVNFFKSIR